MNVVLTNAKPGDAKPIASILSDWIDETDWMPRLHSVDQDQAHALLLLDRTEVTVARARRRIVGFMATRDASVHALYLAPQARGQGIGRHLLDHAKERHRRLDLWTFQANTAARRFYVGQGFYENRLTNGEGNDENLPDVHLVWARGMA